VNSLVENERTNELGKVVVDEVNLFFFFLLIQFAIILFSKSLPKFSQLNVSAFKRAVKQHNTTWIFQFTTWIFQVYDCYLF